MDRRLPGGGRLPPALLSIAAALLLAVAGFAAAAGKAATGDTSGAKPSVVVCFSPPLSGGCDPTLTVVRALDTARYQVLVQAYEFTSAPIAKALVDAKRRGLDVRVIFDKAAARGGYSEATYLEHSGVPVAIDHRHKIAHNKVMVVDGRRVITGSFNFTKTAEEQNAENLVVIDDPATAAQYVQNWMSHAAHSVAVGASADSNPRGSGRSGLAAVANGTIVGNRRSHIYAWPGCGSYDTMSPGNRVVFSSTRAAEAAGYRAARNCPSASADGSR